MRTQEKMLLWVVLLFTALLRFGGMSHDLHEWQFYHPDSPKQIRAVQLYYEGKYFWHVNGTNGKFYNGYPLFHARIIESVLRVVEPARAGVSRLLGIPTQPNLLLNTMSLYWIMLTMNAAFSTLIVLIVFNAGRETFGATAGWIAALLAVFSPADIISTHMATGDATTAFFVALSLLWTLRVYRLGRYRDYALAATFATFAFAAKYYGATAFFALALAHITRAGILRPVAWFSPDARRRIGIAAAATIIALTVAIPALVTNFSAEVVDIWGAMIHSTQRFPESMNGAGGWQRFLFSMRVNLPDFLHLISPAALVACIMALVGPLRRDARVWILIIGPLLYIFLAVGSRAGVNPVYHTNATSPLFLLTAFCCVWTFGVGGRMRFVSRACSVAVIAISISLFAVDAAREFFFAWHMDARRISATWVGENVPRKFSARTSRYSFLRPANDQLDPNPPGLVFGSSGLNPMAPPEGSIPLKRIDLERSSMTQFRNVRQDIFVYSPKLLRAGFSMPVSQRWPSQGGNMFIADNGVEFLRSEKSFILDHSDGVSRWVVKDKPLEEVWIIAQSTSVPATLHVSFGGHSETLRFDSDSSACVRIAKPRSTFPSRSDLLYYLFEINPSPVLMRVSIATQPGEAGRILAQLGRHADATPMLVTGALAANDISAAAQALISARAAKIELPPDAAARLAKLAAPVLSVTDDESLFAAYGIHRAYLDELPFLELRPEQLTYNGFRLARDPFAGDNDPAHELTVSSKPSLRPLGDFYAVWARNLMLDPGCYKASFLVRSPQGPPRGFTMRLTILDAHDKPILERDLEIPPLDTRLYTVVPFAFTIPVGVAASTISVRTVKAPDLAVGGLNIRPDPLANAISLGKALQAAQTADTK